jgi:glyoxylase-like metal-dependent hydrolase (beta-lactamase superfamily II)
MPGRVAGPPLVSSAAVAELVDSLAVGVLQCNCSIVTDGAARDAVVVDPGDDAPLILEILRAHGLRLRAIVHSHAHFDHVLAGPALARETGATLWLHREDLPLYENVPMQMAMFGMPGAPSLPGPDRFYEHGDRVPIGPQEPEAAEPVPRAPTAALRVLHTPGHTPGSVSFLSEGSPLLFSGDTLFKLGVGRTDLWGGSWPRLMRSIREQILTLPGDTRVIPGHGPETSIAAEARHNPFLQG